MDQEANFEMQKGRDGNENLQLFICNSGKGDNPFAQDVANATDRPVRASTEWIYPTEDGGYLIAEPQEPGNEQSPPNFDKLGGWKTFFPQKH